MVRGTWIWFDSRRIQVIIQELFVVLDLKTQAKLGPKESSRMKYKEKSVENICRTSEGGTFVQYSIIPKPPSLRILNKHVELIMN